MSNDTSTNENIVTLQDAKQSLLKIRIISSELDSGITNVNRGNPMLARALREKVGMLRKEFDNLEYFLAARSTSEESNGEMQQEEQGTSKETSSATETSTAGSNTSKSEDDGGRSSTEKGQDSGDDSSTGGENYGSPKPEGAGSGESHPMTAAEKIAARKAKQQGDKD
jgi:hypothetical protein